jgi:hypothetical protein
MDDVHCSYPRPEKRARNRYNGAFFKKLTVKDRQIVWMARGGRPLRHPSFFGREF